MDTGQTNSKYTKCSYSVLNYYNIFISSAYIIVEFGKIVFANSCINVILCLFIQETRATFFNQTLTSKPQNKNN